MRIPTLPPCTQCGLENTYLDGEQLICPDCGFEGPSVTTPSEDEATDESVVKDANGQRLTDGDSVILVKDLKVKGASAVLKKGTKIKGIRLVDEADGHNVDCKTDLGSLLLKSAFLKKA